jgi:hypothetical protein
MELHIENLRFAEQMGGAVAAQQKQFFAELLMKEVKQSALVTKAILEAPRPAEVKLTVFAQFGCDYQTVAEKRREFLTPLRQLSRILPSLLPPGAAKAMEGTRGALMAGQVNSTPLIVPTKGHKPNQRDGWRAEEGQAAKRVKADETRPKLQPQDKTQRVLPGSKSWLAKMVDPEHLLLGQKVYDVKGLEKELGAKLCWPVVLSSKEASARMVLCPSPRAQGHEHAHSKCHKVPPQLAGLLQKHSVDATEDQRKLIIPASNGQRHGAP